jgi:vacuolar-type H+-ATPase subunit E/Vma4
VAVKAGAPKSRVKLLEQSVADATAWLAQERGVHDALIKRAADFSENCDSIYQVGGKPIAYATDPVAFMYRNYRAKDQVRFAAKDKLDAALNDLKNPADPVDADAIAALDARVRAAAKEFRHADDEVLKAMHEWSNVIGLANIESNLEVMRPVLQKAAQALDKALAERNELLEGAGTKVEEEDLLTKLGAADAEIKNARVAYSITDRQVDALEEARISSAAREKGLRFASHAGPLSSGQLGDLQRALQEIRQDGVAEGWRRGHFAAMLGKIDPAFAPDAKSDCPQYLTGFVEGLLDGIAVAARNKSSGAAASSVGAQLSRTSDAQQRLQLRMAVNRQQSTAVEPKPSEQYDHVSRQVLDRYYAENKRRNVRG